MDLSRTTTQTIDSELVEIIIYISVVSKTYRRLIIRIFRQNEVVESYRFFRDGRFRNFCSDVSIFGFKKGVPFFRLFETYPSLKFFVIRLKCECNKEFE